jgi:hypothetical protein
LEAFERLGAVRGFAADCLFAPSRRFVAVRCLAVVRRFAAVRRFGGIRFFRDERDAAARFLRFAIGCLQSEISTLSKKICSHRGTHSARFCIIRVTAGTDLRNTRGALIGFSRESNAAIAARLTRSPAFPTTLEGTPFATICGAVEKPVDIVAVFAL